MKYNLGKMWILLYFLSLPVMLTAMEDFTYNFNLNKNNPYTKEAVVLTLDINQTNPDVVLLFDFDLVKNKNYTYQRVGIQEKGTSHALQIRYIYLIYPLIHGTVDIRFTLKKKVTTDDSIAYSFSGDRDNVKGLVTKDYNIKLAPVLLNVKPLPKNTQLVGDFNLSYKIKKHQRKAYEAIPFTLTIKGKGFPPLLKNIVPKDINFTLFTDKPIIHTNATKEGTVSTIVYSMAFSHYTDFTLLPITIQAFNPLSQKIYPLRVPLQKFTITEVNKTKLVDSIDSPPILKEDWSWLKNLISYFIVFISGYLTAKSFQWQKKQKQKNELSPLIEKIKLSKNEKELLQVLMANDSQLFSTYINALEDSLYANGKINLEKVKKEALGLL